MKTFSIQECDMYIALKRILDFIFAALFLVALLIPFIVIALLLTFTGEGKVFYLQERVGHNQQKFMIYKFATMLENSMNLGLKGTTVRNDPRVTNIGKYLRLLKVNELPQLINVFVGEMSFVGPRPLPPNSYLRYEDNVRVIISRSRPGITGIGSLVFRDEEKIITEVINKNMDHRKFFVDFIYPYKGELEKWYYQNVSFTTDIKIIFLTAWYIIAPNSVDLYKVFRDLPMPHRVLDSMLRN